MKRRFLIIVSTIIGVILLFLIFYLVNATLVFSHMVKVGPLGIGVFVGNAILIMVVGGISWQIILRAYGHYLPFWDVLKIKTIGFAVSYLTPSMYVGGEPIRIYLLGKKYGVSMTRIGATVVVDKFLELGAGLFYILMGSIFVLIRYSLPWQLFVILVFINAALVGVMVLLLVGFVWRTRPFSTVVALVGKVKPFKKIVRIAMPTVLRLEREIYSAFGKYGKKTLRAFFLNLLIGGLVFVKPAIFFYFLNTLFNLSQLALLFALTHLLLALQFTPGALGIFEWGEVGIFGLIGVKSERALAYSLMVRITDLMMVAAAGVIGLHMGVKYFWGRRKNEDMRGF